LKIDIQARFVELFYKFRSMCTEHAQSRAHLHFGIVSTALRLLKQLFDACAQKFDSF